MRKNEREYTDPSVAYMKFYTSNYSFQSFLCQRDTRSYFEIRKGK